MFNGIIKNTGIINKISKRNNNCVLEILSKMKFSKSEIGSSVSCSGACLTVEKLSKKKIIFYLSKETLNKTVFKLSKRGDLINLEKSLKYGERVSGHFVQGHVDTTATVNKMLDTRRCFSTEGTGKYVCPSRKQIVITVYIPKMITFRSK